MRGYFILQYQMEGIHAGIQSMHAMSKMSARRPQMTQDQAMVFDTWNAEHCTAILLNGGYQERLLELEKILEDNAEEAGWPIGIFRESVAASNGLLTCVGLVIPDERPTNEIWESYLFEMQTPRRSAQWNILSAIKDLRLAR